MDCPSWKQAVILIYSLGDPKTAIQRLNGAQAFNALGSVIGILFAIEVQSRLSQLSMETRQVLPLKQFNILKNHDLSVLIQPYIFIGAVVLLIMVMIILKRMPTDTDITTTKKPTTALRNLLHRRSYRDGVVAQFCYIGAQIACWSYIIQYGARIFIEEGMNEGEAGILAQKYNIAAMILFASSRFICTWLMRWFTPSRMLSTMGIIGMAALIGTIVFTDRNGLYCLVLVGGCLSLMFPTIFGLAITGVGEDIKIAGAGLIMAILGGSFFPPIQAIIIDSGMTICGLPSTNISFIVPLLCMSLVVLYGHNSYVRNHIRPDDVDDKLSIQAR